MCHLTEEFEEPCGVKHACKRKYFGCDNGKIYTPPKRITPFSNTPKERKDERRKILKLSVKKLKGINNAELCLRRSLLIQNTLKRLQDEMRLNKQSKSWRNRVKTARMVCRCHVPTSFKDSPLMCDDHVINGLNENISDDMTDTLMKNLEEKIGCRLGCCTSEDDGSTSQRICETPVSDVYKSTACTMKSIAPAPVETENTDLNCAHNKFVPSFIQSKICSNSVNLYPIENSIKVYPVQSAEKAVHSHFGYENMQTSFEKGYWDR